VHCRQPRIARKSAQLERNLSHNESPGKFRARRKTMKKQVLAVAALAVVAAFVPTTSHAQTSTKADVPFTFQAGDKVMTPGEYKIGSANIGVGRLQLIEQSDSRNRSYLATKFMENDNRDGSARLTFHCYNHDCFLYEVWDGNGRGWRLFESNREKELAQNSVNIQLAVVTLPMTHKS
jgi:hypothetical protein